MFYKIFIGDDFFKWKKIKSQNRQKVESMGLE